MKRQKKSSLLTKYTALYEKNPKSRVFAPLAESYRKLGMIEEALKILRDGIKRHPTYVMGYIVLAHCYFDQQNHELAYNTIRPFVSKNLENISLQKLFAQICINLGYLEEALQTFKYLLLLNPKDKFVSEQVKLLEDDLLVDEEELDSEEEFREQSAKGSTSFEDDEDEWIQVDFNKGSLEKREASEEEGDLDDWSVEAPVKKKLSSFKSEIESQNLTVAEHDLDDEYFYEEYDNSEEEKDPVTESADPIITHTLVDLYIRQGHVDKAKEILKSILELHPEDKASAQKLASLEKQIIHEEGRSGETDLANLVEQKVRSGELKSKKLVENKLNVFLQKIKKEARARLDQYP